MTPSVSRVLIVREGGGEVLRDVRVLLHGRPIEFDSIDVAHLLSGRCDLLAYEAVVVPMDLFEQGIAERLASTGADGPQMLLTRGTPSPHDVARWIASSKPRGEADDTPLTERLLSESLEFYSLASLFQQCLRILSAQDEDQRLALITDTFTNELSAESCVFWLTSAADPDEMTITAVRGAIGIDREGSRFYLSQSDLGESIWNGVPFLEADGGGLYIPLIFREKPIGLVKLGARVSGVPWSDRDTWVARIVAEHAAVSLSTADRLLRVEKVSLRDSDTGAHSAAFLQDYFEKESYKAGRFRRPLSVLFLLIDNFNFLMENTRENLVIGALSSIVDAVRKALRDSDLIARVEPNRFCIVLPETDAFGAILALRRLRKSIRDKCGIRYLGSDYLLSPYFLTATYPRDGRDLRDLWTVAAAKHVRQRKSPYHRLLLQEKPFWDAFDALMGKPEHYDALRRGEEVPYFSRIRRDLGRNSHFILPRDGYLRMIEAVAQDILAPGDERELIIAAGPRPEVFKQIFLSYGSDFPPGRNIYVIGQTGSSRFDAKNLLYVNTEDERLRDREMVLFLKENGAYAIFSAGASDGGDEVVGFNTSDEWVVEGMMEKIQEMYSLQGNF